MIYIKIYLDKDENGEDMLVFDSAKEDSKYIFTVAGKKQFGNYNSIVYQTEVNGVEKVAISPEAKSLFIEMLNDKNVCIRKYSFPDFQFFGYGWGQHGLDSGSFAYFPPNIKNGDTKRILHRGESFSKSYTDISAFEYMTPCENEMLKSLDITNPIDENVLLDNYYSTMRARGEELGCDVETIRKTPVRYLTEEQREVIRAEYRRMAASYSSQEWNESRDYDHAAMLEDKIREAITKKYWKFIGD
ncbi:MAG: hypothetical protein IJ515_05715 [Clostridia bacterium]|nr:hypothetical protein [Clostridia bacterium]